MPAQEQLLKRLSNAMKKARRHLKPTKSLGSIRLWVLKSFTDNFVLGWPCLDDDAEGELGSTFFRVALFQAALIEGGFFCRGAISVGPLYMDNHMVFGSGLIDAYDAESRLARDPRIILTEFAEAQVKHHVSYYSSPAESPQQAYLLRDADGYVFVNYLNIILEEAGRNTFLRTLRIHRTQIEKKLSEHKTEPIHWNKYLWCANYHNYVCTNSISEAERLSIDLVRFQPRPAALIPE